QIKQKAGRLFPKAVEAWLAGDLEFFPHRLRVNLQPPKNPADAVRWNEQLSAAAKPNGGKGYHVVYQRQRKRWTGDNDYPSDVLLDTLDDVAACSGKLGELRTLRRSVDLIRSRTDKLDSWLVKNWRRVLKASDDIAALLTIVAFLQDNPRPGCYVRELPIAVSTKTVERHKSLLQDWLDLTLPPEQIDFAALDNFEMRYGFARPRRHYLLRLLDPDLVVKAQLPASELSMPAASISKLAIHPQNVWVIENKVTLLALPELKDSVALGGSGNDLSQYEQIEWLVHPRPDGRLRYWGDIDVEGFEILARFRRVFPSATSFQMDIETLNRHRSLCIPGKGQTPETPPGLTASEQAAFEICRSQNIRLEQERVPFPAIVERL
ncbi:MAG TPA: hypothetical protein DDW52_15765, partial [Planctomycetaceae bacterium]|nr:hypothetical protein [Planctomycetaceae bacterium]